MNTEFSLFDEPRPAPSTGSNSLMWILLAVLIVVVAGGGFVRMYQQVNLARIAARRSSSKNNLKQIGLAMHYYHEVYSMFPPLAIIDETGTPRQGWNYSILPFIDQTPLFNSIDSDYAWNDPHNDHYSREPVVVYLNPAIPETRDPTGYGLSHYAGNSHVFQPNKGFRFNDILDGSANTLMIGEINDGFQPWAKPVQTRDPMLGLNKGPGTFGSPFEGGVQFLMMDGGVRFLNDDIDPEILKGLATPDGGEEIAEDW